LDGDVVAESMDYTFVVEGSTDLMAHFRQVNYGIFAFAKGQGSVKSSKDSAPHGANVTVEAEPSPGYRFTHWEEEGEPVSSEAVYTFMAAGERNLTAVFVPALYSIDLEVQGNGGRVLETWTMDPVKVTLQAIAEEGYEFFGWVDMETKQEIATQAMLSLDWKGNRKIMARFREELIFFEGSNLLAVVGKQTTIGKYAPDDLVELPNHLSRKNRKVRKEVAEALEVMAQAAQAEGVDINVDSGYRSYDTQHGLFYRYAGNDGILAAERYSARPGQSEHQLGTAVDFGGTSKDYTSAFFNTSQGTWLFNNAHKYGFALSYPKDSEEITGYIYEPWHYRYIGVDAALEWKQSGLTLIEFLWTKNQAN